MKRRIEALCVWIVLLLVPPLARADVAPVATRAFPFLNIPTDPRALAMGQSGVADLMPRAQAYNPAVLAFAEGFSYTLSSVNWLTENSDLMDMGVHSGRPLGDSRARLRVGGAIGYKQLRISEPNRTIFLPQGTGRTFDANDWHLSLVGAAALQNPVAALAIGFAAKPVHSRLADASVNAWAFDLGALARYRFENENGARITGSMGVSALNFGPQVDYGSLRSDLPRQVRAGMGLRIDGTPVTFAGRTVPVASVTVMGDYIDELHSSDHVAAGVEAGMVDALYVRLGSLDNVDQDYDTETFWGVGGAWSFHRLRLSVDYGTYDLSPAYRKVEAWGVGALYTF